MLIKVRKVVEFLLMRILKSVDFTKATKIDDPKYIVLYLNETTVHV